MPSGESQTSGTENLSHKQLKALAKASRPFYKKKRYWFLAIVAIVVIIIIAVQAGGSNSHNGVTTQSGNQAHPPQADVQITKCAEGPVSGLPDIEVKITNHSSQRSNYLIQANLLDHAGTKIGDAVGSSNNVEPGQTAIERLAGTTTGTLATCRLASVNRYASPG